MKRVVIVGCSGAGKTTLARQLAERLGVPHVELDALHWEPNWKEAELAVLRERVDTALAGEAWVTDGNYGKVRDLVWPRADTLVWLDYSLGVVMRRVTARTLVRCFRGEELWSGNRERFWHQFVPRDSIIWWSLTHHRVYRRNIPAALAQPDHAHLRLLRFRTPAAASVWLESVNS